MEKEKYLASRETLLNESEQLTNEGKIEDAKAKVKEVEALDNQWEESKLLNANVEALRDKTKGIDMENASVNPQAARIVDSMAMDSVQNDAKTDEKKLYENAWAKTMQGKPLDSSEQKIYNKVNAEFSNAYTHDTNNTSVLIPETVVAGIWKRATEMYPFLADVKKFNVRGTLTIKKHSGIAAGDAAFYAEGTATADEQNTFAELTLSGCELAKAITITWKLRSMAVEEFIPFIQNELAERIGVTLGNAVVKGKGPTATPREPEGVETALLAESDKPQVVEYDPEATTPIPLSYTMFTAAIGKIHSSYLANAAIYASNATIWNQLANLVDGQGRPLFIPDVTAGGVGRMFGMVVKPDAGVTEGSIIIGNPLQGYVMNTNEPMSVATEEHVKARTVDYAAYTIVDGGVLDTKAFALIRNKPAA
jgi:HK97 family phage major capsid protein